MTPSGDAAHLSGAAAIAGLGFSAIGKVYGRGASGFAVDAARAAIADAGLGPEDVDGLIVSYGITPAYAQLPPALGMRDLRLNVNLNAAGATAAAAIQYAAMAVAGGLADCIVYVHADAPLHDPATRAGAAYGAAAARRSGGFTTVAGATGLPGANPHYALAARRHMLRYGTTAEQLGAVAVAQRAWAAGNPLARYRDPLTLEDHGAARLVADPFRLYDCCMVTNGAIAFVVTSAARAALLARPPVYIWGWGQGHPVYPMGRGSELGLRTGAAIAGPAAFKMAGITAGDVDQAQLYDCYTYTVIVTLEDYGFCEKGEGGPFAASGALARGGSLPTNTGGGQLSAYYLWGATPLSEAVIQARGDGGERQAPANDVILVSGNGGILDYHGTLIVSPHPRAA
ncbi:MAG TPA: thiolase family protein [Acidimicrobiales bacterium]|nr:thiolase family protein [Acidimicrobiales bacterium]